MSSGTAKVEETALCQNDDSMAIREDESVALGLDVLPLHSCIGNIGIEKSLKGQTFEAFWRPLALLAFTILHKLLAHFRVFSERGMWHYSTILLLMSWIKS